ncbi:MAG: HlyC/CorC family transporter [Eggerthellaceae bacterium]|nr:HlyC/CorC family transporter [Eggerthellaceae bacterium]
MPIWLSILFLIFFICMNAFFVMAEFSLVRVRRSQLDIMVEKTIRGAKKARKMAEQTNEYLSACQLGVTIASLALGWLGEPAISRLFRPLLEPLEIDEGFISAISVAIGFIIVTSCQIVLGELIPKIFAMVDTGRIACRTSGILYYFYKISSPIMFVFNSITNGVLKLTGYELKKFHSAYTEEEIQLLIDESTESGLIEKSQNEYVDNIFEMGDMDAEAIMSPRTDLVCIDLEDDVNDVIKIILKEKYTRYPICRGEKDNIIGFAHVKDLFSYRDSARSINGLTNMSELHYRKIVAVPYNMPVAKLLRTLQKERTKIALVVDEHGGTAGVVTMSDIFEQIVGRVDDEYIHDTEDEIIKLKENVYEIDGSISIAELEDILGFVPDVAEDADAVSGVVLELFDRIPKEGESRSFSQDDLEIEVTVLEMDVHRIEKVRLEIKKKVNKDK